MESNAQINENHQCFLLQLVIESMINLSVVDWVSDYFYSLRDRNVLLVNSSYRCQRNLEEIQIEQSFIILW